MKENDNMHAGHRERMTDKILISPSSLADHELLEVLLYSTLPRVDTNPLAHKLLDVFGSLDNLFNASMQELMIVKGVGKRTAANIKVCGEIFKRTLEKKNNKRVFNLNPHTFIDYFDSRLKNKRTEELVILMLSDKLEVVSELNYGANLLTEVNAEIKEIAKAISLNGPKYMVIAHNHPDGSATPSKSDDLATTKLVLLAMAHGVIVLDHIIITKQTYYSYHIHGNLDKIRESCRTENVLK